MSTDDNSILVHLIQSKFQELHDRQDLQTESILTKMESGFKSANSRIDVLAEQKKIQNGRIGKLETNLGVINKKTRIWQFIQSKPWYAAGITIVFVAGIIYLSDNPAVLNLVKIFKIF